MEVTWFSVDDMKAAVDAFVKKYDDEDLNGTNDAELFFKAMGGAILKSKDSDDEDEQDFYEDLLIDIEEYTSLAYFIEVRGSDKKFIMRFTADEQKVGLYSGEYEAYADIKNNIWMDWTPETQLQIMTGNPNTDAQFFSGDLTVKGSLKLASKPRQWIYSFFDFIDREVD